MQINIIGNIFSATGYSSHTRQLALGIALAGGDVRIESDKPLGWEAMVTDAELRMLQKPKDKDRVDIAICLPNQWRYFQSDAKRFIGFLVWEGDKIPEFWKKFIADNNVDAVFVPSKHVLDAVKMVKDKIHIIPHGIDKSIFNQLEKKKHKKCVFLANKGWAKPYDRGGMQFIVEAFMQEFTKKDKVELRLKINKVYNPAFDVAGELKKYKAKTKNPPDVKYLDTNIEYKLLNEFYNDGDVFVSASMAEGFNLPCLEAMGCGLPVICTGFGGQTDFVDNKNGWLVNYKLQEVKNDFMYEGIKWAVPNLKDLRKKMRDAYDLWKINNLKVKSAIALSSANKFTWLNSGKKVLEIVRQLE